MRHTRAQRAAPQRRRHRPPSDDDGRRQQLRRHSAFRRLRAGGRSLVIIGFPNQPLRTRPHKKCRCARQRGRESKCSVSMRGRKARRAAPNNRDRVKGRRRRRHHHQRCCCCMGLFYSAGARHHSARHTRHPKEKATGNGGSCRARSAHLPAASQSLPGAGSSRPPKTKSAKSAVSRFFLCVCRRHTHREGGQRARRRVVFREKAGGGGESGGEQLSRALKNIPRPQRCPFTAAASGGGICWRCCACMRWCEWRVCVCPVLCVQGVDHWERKPPPRCVSVRVGGRVLASPARIHASAARACARLRARTAGFFVVARGKKKHLLVGKI